MPRNSAPWEGKTFVSFYFRCQPCGFSKVLRVEGRLSEIEIRWFSDPSIPAPHKLVYAKAYTGATLDVFYTDKEIAALRALRGDDPDPDRDDGFIAAIMGAL